MLSSAHRLRAAWPNVRAAIVTFHCLAVGLVAIAQTVGDLPISVDNPRFATEAHPWAALLGMPDDSFARRAEAIRLGWISARERTAGPLERYLAIVGAEQPWNMFCLPSRTPPRFALEVSTLVAGEPVPDGEWHLLSGLPAQDWRRAFFESERTRSVLNNIESAHQWSDADDFCRYLGREALREDPARARARCTFALAPAPRPPWEVGTFSKDRLTPRLEYTRVVDREP